MSCALLLGFWAGGIGVPVPTSDLLLRKADEPFSCRYHACGCSDAESCRLHCCCDKPQVSRPLSCCASGGEKSESAGGPAFRAFDCKGVTVWAVVASVMPVPVQNPAEDRSLVHLGRTPLPAEDCPESFSLDQLTPPPELPV